MIPITARIICLLTGLFFIWAALFSKGSLQQDGRSMSKADLTREDYEDVFNEILYEAALEWYDVDLAEEILAHKDEV